MRDNPMSLSRREAILGGAIAVGGAVALKAKEALAGQGSSATRLGSLLPLPAAGCEVRATR